MKRTQRERSAPVEGISVSQNKFLMFLTQIFFFGCDSLAIHELISSPSRLYSPDQPGCPLIVSSPAVSRRRLRTIVFKLNDLYREVVYETMWDTGERAARAFSRFFLSRILPASADGQLRLDSCLRTCATVRSYGRTLSVRTRFRTIAIAVVVCRHTVRRRCSSSSSIFLWMFGVVCARSRIYNVLRDALSGPRWRAE